jgi:hypothetical protein
MEGRRPLLILSTAYYMLPFHHESTCDVSENVTTSDLGLEIMMERERERADAYDDVRGQGAYYNIAGPGNTYTVL